MGFYILCPYFVSQLDTRVSLTCEDCIRYFGTIEKKNKWIKQYCEVDWESCPFADRLNNMYERIENMVDSKYKEIEEAQSKYEMATANNKRLLSEIGRLKAKIKKQEKQIEEMNEIAKANFETYRSSLEGERNKYLAETFKNDLMMSAFYGLYLEKSVNGWKILLDDQEEIHTQIDVQKYIDFFREYTVETTETDKVGVMNLKIRKKNADAKI